VCRQTWPGPCGVEWKVWCEL